MGSKLKHRISWVGLTLSSLFYPLLGKDPEWIIFMDNHLKKVFLENQKKKTSKVEIFLFYLNFYIYMEDIIDTESSHEDIVNHIIDQIKQQSLTGKVTQPSSIQSLFLKIVTNYYALLSQKIDTENIEIQNNSSLEEKIKNRALEQNYHSKRVI